MTAAAAAFPVYLHANMLGDHVRVERFRAAIDRTVRPLDRVLDVGSGTGILTGFAAARTQARVVGLDLDATTIPIARAMARAASLDHVEFVHTPSVGRPVDIDPDVVITETLGPLGVDEHIVEVCFELRRSYPTIRTIVPCDVRIMAVPVRSAPLEAYQDTMLQSFERASFGSFDFRAVADEIRAAWCRSIFISPIRDAIAVGEPTTVATFELGVDRTSRFSKTVRVPDGATFVHLYFESRLASGVELSTSVFEPPTHWPAHFVARLPSADEVTIEYEPKQRHFWASWGAR